MSAPGVEGVREIFSDGIKNKRFAYLPVDGGNTPQKYIDEWRGYAERYDAEFVYINNSIENATAEQEKLLRCDICFISGGNTFLLLRNLRRSGLDKALKKFVQKDEFILAGASAGALVLTPTIEVCNQPSLDKNQVGLTDLTGLGLVDFEVWPHYVESYHSEMLEKYQVSAKNEVKEVRDGSFVSLELDN